MDPAGPPDLRASDADRDAAVAHLRTHALAGRLDAEELEERVAAALAARTHGELAALQADLPSSRAGGPPAARGPLPRPAAHGLGVRPFQQQHLLRGPRPPAFAETVRHVVPRLHAHGFAVVARDEPALLVLEARERPPWVWLVCVAAFPLGLVALAFKRSRRLVLTFDDDGGDTLLTVQGEASRAVRRGFADLAG